MAEPRPAASPPRSRSRLRRTLGCLVTGPLGCLAFFVGALLAVVAMTPSLLGPWLTRSVVEGFNHDRAGELQIEAIEPSWFDRQALRNLALRTPEGETVLRGSASVPSLLDLLRDELDDYGRVEVTIEELNLRVEEDGRTNLDRALELTVRADRRRMDLEAPRLTDTPARYAIRVESMRWEDERTRRAGSPLAIADVECSLEVLPDGRVAVEVVGEEGVQLDVAFVWRAPRNGDERPFLDVERVRLEAIPSSTLDALTGRRAVFARLLGPSFDLTGYAREGSGAEGGVDLALTAERAELRLRGTRTAGELRTGGAGLSGTLRWPSELADELLGAATERLGLARLDPEQPLTVEISDLVLPAAALEREAAFGARLAGLAGTLDLGLGDWECARPGTGPAPRAPGAGGVDARRVRLADVHLSGSVAGPAEARELELRVADAGGALAARLGARLDALGALLDGEELEGRGATLEVLDLPPQAIERWLGPAVEVELAGAGETPLTVELERASWPRAVDGASAGWAQLAAEARVAVPRLALRDPARPGSKLVLAGLAGPLAVRPGEGVRVELEGRIVDLAPGTARVSLAGGPAAEGAAGRPVELSAGLALESVPAALADAWLGTRTWVADLFGPRLESLEAVLDRVADGAPHAGLRLRSRAGVLAVAGRVVDGALVPEPDGAARASFELTPACAAPLVSWLAPLLVDVAPAPGGERAELLLRAFRLPLGDPLGRDRGGRGLVADLELVLGPFTYRVLPGLAARANLAPELTRGRSPGHTYRARVEAGLVRYDAQEIPLGPEHSLAFTGSQDIETHELNLSSRVPMALLVEGEDGLLEMLQGVLDEEDASPFLVVHGTYAQPTVLIDSVGLNDFVLGLGERALRETIPAFLEARARKEKGKE